MKLSYINQALVDLNDGENIEYDTSFVTAANLALAHISRIVPDERVAIILQESPVISVIGNVDTSRRYTAAHAAAVSLKAIGTGKLFCDGVKIAAWETGGRYRDIRAELSGEGAELSFSITKGSVRDLAVWRNDFGGTQLIPEYGRHVRYDMRQIVDDYGGYPDSPIDTERGVSILDCVLQSPYVLLPASFSGEAAVYYRHRPDLITLDDVGNDIDIDIKPEYEDLVPLCMAYYIWLEDEPTKAQFFLARFNEAAALAKQQYRAPGNNTVISRKGW
jgi:hypothetical protein